MSDPDDALWDYTAGLAERHIPATGRRSVRVTRHETGEFTAVATVTITSGCGSEECCTGIGDTWQDALRDLQRRLRGDEGEAH